MSNSKSVIISCAGIGSRLGLSKTKALININGRSLISWQLELFKNVEDLRIVVGFQAQDVIKEVCKYRNDVIFIFNHNYFDTKTGASYYLGAKDAENYAIEYDGDLLVHPDDMDMLLNKAGEWIAFTDKSSEDSVLLTVDNNNNVTSFSREKGLFEWTGPCCLKKERVKFTTENVYNQLEQLLPLPGVKIRAYDIDTFDDYIRVQQAVINW